MRITLTKLILFVCFFFVTAPIPLAAQPQPPHEELIYGHKGGMALVMEKVSPAKPNGKAVISLMSGGYASHYNWLPHGLAGAKEFLARGYTVFLVFHGTQPQYNVGEITKDISRAVRYIRFNAKKLKLDPDHIGITGSSSGGHLSLYAATSDETANPSAEDPIDRVSSKLQAVCVFYPPTDFLNFGETGVSIITDKAVASDRRVAAAFDFRVWDDSLQQYVMPPVERQIEKMKSLSPVYLIDKGDAPAYIVHGDKDWVVPLQQSELLQAKYKAAGVPFELVVKKDGDHGWPDENLDREKMAAWFDKYLK